MVRGFLEERDRKEHLLEWEFPEHGLINHPQRKEVATIPGCSDLRVM